MAPNGSELGTLERKKEAAYVIRNAEGQSSDEIQKLAAMLFIAGTRLGSEDKCPRSGHIRLPFCFTLGDIPLLTISP
jgi:hypothetical protein